LGSLVSPVGIWTTQQNYILELTYLLSHRFGFQSWHSAAEFRRAVRQYLPDIHNLSITDGLDITGYYQYEFLHRPIYSFLKSCGVDFQFRTEVKNIELAQNTNQRTITGLYLIQDQLELHISLGKNDIVLVNLGSTISGSTIGTNDIPPTWNSITADDMLDQNWSAWLDLGNKNRVFGNPYNFCTRQSESKLESFTITTEDVKFFDKLKEISRCTSEAGAFISLKNSRWRMNLCIPCQPVFTQQPQNVRVLWGLAHSPECEGNYVDKPMLWCSGTDIMAELLNHLDLNHQEPMQRTITIPRAMPRMSAILLTRTLNDRPQVIPQAFANVGLVGQFVEIPRSTCVDISYGIHAAEMAVSGLMGSPAFIEPSTSIVSAVWKIMLCK
jgi:oleate hydratase